MEKQKEVKGRFNISDIQKAVSKKNKTKNQQPQRKSKENKKLITLRFRIDRDTEELFNHFRNNFAVKNKKFGINESEFFKLMTTEIKDLFLKRKIFKHANKEFKDFVTRAGKRKSTDRTPNEKNTTNLMIKVSDTTNDNYIDLMFSFYSKYNQSTLYDTYLSRTYFFYDFINLIKQELNYG